MLQPGTLSCRAFGMSMRNHVMAATFDWQEDTGTQTGSPLKGTTRTTGVTDVNWKNSGTQGDVYSSYPITAGNNSYIKYQFGKFTGTFNQISGGKFSHTAGTLGTGLTLVSRIGDSIYLTPVTTALGSSTDITSITAIGSGATVLFGATGPEAGSKASSSTNATTYSEYIATQLQTSGSAAAGDTATVTLTMRYLEN